MAAVLGPAAAALEQSLLVPIRSAVVFFSPLSVLIKKKGFYMLLPALALAVVEAPIDCKTSFAGH